MPSETSGRAAQNMVRSVVVLGAGAMGCLFAARMMQAGAQVTLVDTNASRLDQLGREGLDLEDDFGAWHGRPGTARAADVTGPVDLIVLFTKGMHSEAAVASVTHLAVLRPLALTLQNGVGNAEILAAAFGADRVLMGTAHVPADLATPTRVVSHGFATVHLGGMTAAAHEHVAAVAALLEKGRFKLQVTREVEAAIWEKLAFNAALNATAMVTQSRNGDMNAPGGLRIAAAIVNETVAVARARGLGLDADQIHRSVAQALVEHPHHEASMLQDRKAQRATEIESINGAICREGERLGVPTPVTTTLADLVRLVERKAAGAVRSA